jgi:hypothetical protein
VRSRHLAEAKHLARVDVVVDGSGGDGGGRRRRRRRTTRVKRLAQARTGAHDGERDRGRAIHEPVDVGACTRTSVAPLRRTSSISA